MRITLTANEVKLLRKVCYKFNIEDTINEDLDAAKAYDYVSIKETEEGFTMLIAEKPIMVGLEVLNKMAPKIMQIIGAMKGVFTLVESLFNKDFMKEMGELTNSLTYNTRQKHVVNDETVLEINALGELDIFKAAADSLVIKIALDVLTKEYSSKKELQNTVVGKNIANTVYTLEKALEQIEEAKANEGGRS